MITNWKKRSVLAFGLMLISSVCFAQYSGTYGVPYVPKDPRSQPTMGTAQPKAGGAVSAPAGYGSGQVPGGGNVAPSVTPNTVMPGAAPGARPAGGTARPPMPLLNPYPQAQPMVHNIPVTYGQHTPRGPVEKPFANYQAAPVVSPYMNLYRRDNYTGVDNYTFYVKPALQAEQDRQQTQTRLNELQRAQTEQQAAQYNASVRTATVGASYGQVNTGYTAPHPGASYGFSGIGAPIRPEVAPAPEEEKKTDKEKMDEDGKKRMPVINPYMNNNGFQFEYNP